MSDERTRQRAELIAALLGPDGSELTCEECFEELDRYVDLAVANADPDRAVPGMREHLTGCPACRDDYDSLLELVRSGDGDAPLPPP
ncbi:MAG: hypothetical protein ACRDLN_12680 [Solirubrobacteraceae bacterium]